MATVWAFTHHTPPSQTRAVPCLDWCPELTPAVFLIPDPNQPETDHLVSRQSIEFCAVVAETITSACPKVRQ
ncbi:hypothetical protein RRG08_060232 [Elysia crispata]|uniref:Uncharacterized protein n=1 Tax=Elysia crispata TaxID=231223 RepID=A0AAE0ZXP1_9GAST|nr:hypothetical protein RRG08_060232 [Elysia crispata]